MEQTVKERLRIFIDYLNISTHKFEKNCGLPNAYVSNIRVSITDDKLAKIAERYPQLNKSWLIMGKGDMLVEGHCDRANEVCEFNGIESVCEMPVIPDDMIMKQNVDIYEYMNANKNEVEKLRISHIFPDFDMFYRVISDGMRPQIEKGDLLSLKLIPNKTKIIDGECYVVNSENHGLIIRRLHYKNGVFRCESNLQELGVMDIHEKEVNNVFAIVGLIRMRVSPHAEEVKLFHSNERKGRVIEEMVNQHGKMLNIIDTMSQKIVS